MNGRAGPPSQANLTPPVAGPTGIGFVDSDDGTYLRDRPRPAHWRGPQDGGLVLDQPLASATRVFVRGTYPGAPAWWFVTTLIGDSVAGGYVEGRRLTIDLPEPSAQLYAIRGGDTAERLAARMFGQHVEDGHDLRFYENVLLYVNQQAQRTGVTGTFQDPHLLGGGRNNVQLVAGQRIWLVSPEYAMGLRSSVPSGSFSGGLVAKAKRALGHLADIRRSVDEYPDHVVEVAGEYIQAVKEHASEIAVTMAAFLALEGASALLAATPTGVGQLAAVLIQLLLVYLGLQALVSAGIEALKHAANWLTLAWTANGKAEQISEASRELIRMVVSLLAAALAYLGVRGNLGRAATLARTLPRAGPALAVVRGGTTTGAGSAAAAGIPEPFGTFGAGGAKMVGLAEARGVVRGVPDAVLKDAARLESRISALGDEGLLRRLEAIDLEQSGAAEKIRAIERDVARAEDLVEHAPGRGDAPEPGMSERGRQGTGQPIRFEAGNFAHKWLERLRSRLTTRVVPPEYQARLRSGEIISLDQLPDGTVAEPSLGDTARVDRADVSRGIIYEVKPNTADNIGRGLLRVQEYARLANARKYLGRTDWVGKVVVYDWEAARKLLRD